MFTVSSDKSGNAATLEHRTYAECGGLLGCTIHGAIALEGDGALSAALLDFLSEGLGRATTAQQRSRGDGTGGLHIRNEHAQDWHTHEGG